MDLKDSSVLVGLPISMEGFLQHRRRYESCSSIFTTYFVKSKKLVFQILSIVEVLMTLGRMKRVVQFPDTLLVQLSLDLTIKQ